MRINNVTQTTTNNNSVNFNGFVDQSVIKCIKRRSLRLVERDLFNCGGSIKSVLDTIPEQKHFAESLIETLKNAMEKMHPATGLYKSESDTYFVLKNSITGKKLDVIRISDRNYDKSPYEFNVRYAGIRDGRNLEFNSPHDYFRSNLTGRAKNPAITREDYPDVAAHIKENASMYDKMLGANEISESELLVFEQNKKSDIVHVNEKSKLENFIDRIKHNMKIRKLTTHYCSDKEFRPYYKQALEQYYNMFPDMK